MNKNTDIKVSLANIRVIADRMSENPSKADLLRCQKELYKEVANIEVVVNKTLKMCYDDTRK